MDIKSVVTAVFQCVEGTESQERVVYHGVSEMGGRAVKWICEVNLESVMQIEGGYFETAIKTAKSFLLPGFNYLREGAEEAISSNPCLRLWNQGSTTEKVCTEATDWVGRNWQVIKNCRITEHGETLLQRTISIVATHLTEYSLHYSTVAAGIGIGVLTSWWLFSEKKR